ncbi:type II secretion system F family protein [Methylobacterium organophilum]|uniref:type II secretion system F family protein n=1 Tax=Methylobacterium organophilum TaxID=410 RepID=UPI001F130D43|nr:type II secretion system F family protein [Methylobacterium organophilum]UMY18998.1 type II secretion system F family protein [Methylobacterium organophilum]
MLELIAEKISDPRFVGMVLTGIAVAATAFTLLQPLLEPDPLGKRMKLVSDEREQIRLRERERLNNGKGSLRVEPKAYMKRIVEQFNLSKWLGTETAKAKLMMAGYRSTSAETAFLFFRLVMPAGMALFALFYLFVLQAIDQPFLVRVGLVLLATFIGIKLPEIYLSNQISKRQAEIKRAWPDALDLSLICVESGMSMENAFRRVSTEIATQSVVLAEEFALTTAELSFLPDRRNAYENLANRTGLESVKALTTALIQAERYGTPLGQALRVLAQESRDTRMTEAEKKAAALPPKLTVPMILFFLPVLFVVILTPAIIQAFGFK